MRLWASGGDVRRKKGVRRAVGAGQQGEFACMKVIEGHASEVLFSLFYGAGARLVSVDSDCVKIWNTHSGPVSPSFRVLRLL